MKYSRWPSRAEWPVLAGVALESFGSFMVFALVVLFLKAETDLSASQIALVASVSMVARHSFGFLGGTLSDAYSPRVVVSLGALVRACGYAMFLAQGGFAWWIAANATVGIGGALIGPASRSALALASPNRDGNLFVLRSLAFNLGAVAGPAVAVFVPSFHFAFAMGALVFIAYGIVAWVSFPRVSTSAGGGVLRGFQDALGNLSLVRQNGSIVAVTACFWALYTQFHLTLPLSLAGSPSTFGYPAIVALSAGVTVAWQLGAIAWAGKERTRSSRTAMAGALVFCVGLAAFGFADAALGAIAATIAFSIGEAIFLPEQDRLIARAAPTTKLGGYFGISALGNGIGVLVGNQVGAAAFGWMESLGVAAAFWPAAGAVGFIALMLSTAALSRRADAPAMNAISPNGGSL
ncbi:hypothetical protein ACU16_12595 [Xanthomonas oryzae pv. oryzicola]|nr:hypothetical protein BE73_09770 [Xanthomonas oryzae pv. oryzicola]AKO04843.1 hypothetical protein ACU16_12595 [Xanthomonas oryzae pv. oryzicola]AKO08726.1 hypothetical protein ACU17_12410 [Xanthomonas oryzae pv. oryzicola]OWB25907.1 MFS transporter [Xanthomonas oryzae pv. oryzicola]OWB27803.1 MFS transporter [Xanthomonas oryzae pv. oryzicola]